MWLARLAPLRVRVGARRLSLPSAVDAYKQSRVFDSAARDRPGRDSTTGRWRDGRGDAVPSTSERSRYRLQPIADATEASGSSNQGKSDRRPDAPAGSSSDAARKARSSERVQGGNAPRTPQDGDRGRTKAWQTSVPVEFARRVFDEEKKKLVAHVERLTSRMHLPADQELNAVFKIVEDMKAATGLPLTRDVLVQLLRACELGKDPVRALTVIQEGGPALNPQANQESVLRALHNLGDAVAAEMLRAERVDRRLLDNLERAFAAVLEAGFKPNARTLDVLVRACSAAREPEKAVDYIERFEQDYKITPNGFVLNNVLAGAQAMARVGAEVWVPRGVQLFRRWNIELDRPAFRKLLKICLDRLDLAAAAPVAREMRERLEAGDKSVIPLDPRTAADLIKSCEQAGQAAGLASDLLHLLHASLADVTNDHLKATAAETARQQAAALARAMAPLRKDPNDFYLPVREAYQRAVVACLLQNRLPEALDAFRLVAQRELVLDRGAYIRLLNACSRSGDTETAQRIYDEMTERAGLEPCPASVEALMFAYQNSGDWASCVRALKYLEQLTSRPVDDYNLLRSMALVCAKDAASADGSYYTLTQMRDNGEAVPVAALNAITLGCALFGDLPRAHETFDDIRPGFGLEPTAASYTCLIIGYYNSNNLYGVCAMVERCKAAGVQPDRLALALFYEACVVLCRVRLCLACLEDFSAHRQVPADWYRKLAQRVYGHRRFTEDMKMGYVREIIEHARRLYGRKVSQQLIQDLEKIERDIPLQRARAEARAEAKKRREEAQAARGRAPTEAEARPAALSALAEAEAGEEGSAEERAALERLEAEARARAPVQPRAAPEGEQASEEAGEDEGPAGEAGAEELSIDSAGFSRGEGPVAPRRQPPPAQAAP
eukprot:tig00020592_g11670.t1